MEQKLRFRNIGLSYFLLAIITMCVQYILEFVLQAAAPRSLDIPLVQWIISLAPLYLLAMPICRRFLERVPSVRLYQWKLSPHRWWEFLLMCIFIMYTGNLISNILIAILGNVTNLSLSYSLQDLMGEGNLLVTFVLSVLIAPVLEELFFRKFLVDRTIVFGDKTAIFLSGFMFGLFHGNLYQVIYTFGLGCLLAYLYIRTGRLAYTISLHMTINFVGGVVPMIFLKKLGVADALSGGSANMYGIMSGSMSSLGGLLGYGVFVIFMIVLAIVGLVKFIKYFRHRILKSGQYAMPLKETAVAMFGNVGMILFLAVCAFMFVMNTI